MTAQRHAFVAFADAVCFTSVETVVNALLVVNPARSVIGLRRVEPPSFVGLVEEGINGKLLAEWIGASRSDIIARARQHFTQSFQKNRQNQEMFHRFKNYMEEEQERGVDQPTEESL